MAVQQVLVAVLSVVFTFLGVLVVFRWVLPKLADILDAGVEDQVAVDGLMTLLKVFTSVVALGLIITAVNPLHASLATYTSSVQQGIVVVTSLTKYIAYVVVGAGVLLAIKSWKKSK